jgi:NADH:ubiquinone oxidoreductase subunit 3 (subunit A)
VDVTALTLVAFFALAVALPIVMISIARWLGPREPNALKDAPYECGEIPVGRPWIRYRAAYYVFALVFVVFDIEAAFIFPWTVVFRRLGVAGLIEMAIFVAVLAIGLIYVWRRGLLRWV